MELNYSGFEQRVESNQINENEEVRNKKFETGGPHNSVWQPPIFTAHVLSLLICPIQIGNYWHGTYLMTATSVR